MHRTVTRRLAAAMTAIGLATAGVALTTSPANAAVIPPVTNNNDSGAGSLRAAIEAANTDAALDTITIDFNAATTITVLTPLNVTESLVIDVVNAPIQITHSAAGDLIELAPATEGVTFEFDGPVIFNGAGIEGHAIATVEPGIGNVTITDAQFTTVTTPGYGAGIYVGQGVGTLLVQDSEFTDAGAGGYGGAIAIENAEGSSADLVVEDSSFSDSGALVGGGAIAMLGPGTVTVTATAFTDNEALGPGGALYAAFADDVIVNAGTTFTDNQSNQSSGGAIIVTEASDLEIHGAEFTGNNAYGDGGAVMVETSGSVLIDGATVFENNFSFEEGNGGALAVWESGAVTLSDTQWIDNAAERAVGGAVYIVGSESLEVELSLFSRNESGWGGAIALDELSGTASISTSMIADNVASGLDIEVEPFGGRGGAIWVEDLGDDLDLATSSFIGNRAEPNGDGAESDALGGAVYIETQDAPFSITDTTFAANIVVDNSVGVSVAIYNLFNEVTVVNSTFDEVDIELEGPRTVFAVSELGEAGALDMSHVTIIGGVALQFYGVANGNATLSHAAVETTDAPVIAESEGFTVASEWSAFTQPQPSVIDDVEGNVFELASLQLGPLQDNGNVLPHTREPLPGSPLIDTGNPGIADAPEFDERGEGFVRIVRIIDIGAVEVQAAPTPDPVLPATGGSVPVWVWLAAGVLLLLGAAGVVVRRRMV